MIESLSILETLEIALSLVNVVVYFTVLILAFSCIWRVEKQFDKFLKLVTVALALVPFRLIVGIFGLEQDPQWALAIRGFGFLAGVILIMAFADLLRVIKAMNNESQIQ